MTDRPFTPERLAEYRGILREGDHAIFFDPTLFRDDVSTPLSVTMRRATVLRLRTDQFGRELADVIFDHDPCRISHGHFTCRTLPERLADG